MCGRYTITKKKSQIENDLNIKADEDFIKNYNVAPTNYMPVITNEDSNKINLLHWGLVPYWTKDKKIANKLINARFETIFEKPSFKDAIRRRRCCIIADGYYEWKSEINYKQPYYIHFNNHKIFMFAGIWEKWEGNNGEKINSFSIITTKAKGTLARVHHRSPIILDKTLKNAWLTNLDEKQINKISQNNLGNNLTFYAVSRSVNSTQNNHRELINSI